MSMRHRFKVAVVAGIPGVGKTTVLRHLSSLLEEHGRRFMVLNLGDYMFEAASREGYVKTRDEVRKLSHRLQLDLQRKAASLLVEHASNNLGERDILIVDTHTVIKTPAGLWPGLPEHVVEVLKPDVIVMVEAEPREIVRRQASDTTRNRRDIGRSPEEIGELMLMARIAALISASKTGSAVAVVENPPNAPEEAARRIAEIIEHI